MMLKQANIKILLSVILVSLSLQGPCILAKLPQGGAPNQGRKPSLEEMFALMEVMMSAVAVNEGVQEGRVPEPETPIAELLQPLVDSLHHELERGCKEIKELLMYRHRELTEDHLCVLVPELLSCARAEDASAALEALKALVSAAMFCRVKLAAQQQEMIELVFEQLAKPEISEAHFACIGIVGALMEPRAGIVGLIGEERASDFIVACCRFLNADSGLVREHGLPVLPILLEAINNLHRLDKNDLWMLHVRAIRGAVVVAQNLWPFLAPQCEALIRYCNAVRVVTVVVCT